MREDASVKLIYNKELYNFYNQISFKIPRKRTHIYHLSTMPKDIDDLVKVFSKDDGIDPLSYEGATRFNIPSDLFYRMLFTYRK